MRRYQVEIFYLIPGLKGSSTSSAGAAAATGRATTTKEATLIGNPVSRGSAQYQHVAGFEIAASDFGVVVTGQANQHRALLDFAGGFIDQHVDIAYTLPVLDFGLNGPVRYAQHSPLQIEAEGYVGGHTGLGGLLIASSVIPKGGSIAADTGGSGQLGRAHPASVTSTSCALTLALALTTVTLEQFAKLALVGLHQTIGGTAIHGNGGQIAGNVAGYGRFR